MSQILIKDIKIGKRFRHEVGDIDNLVESIQEVDLLHPIVVDESHNLIAGFRRVKACEKLGWESIPCTTISLDDIVIGEFHENAVRKNFTASEIADISKYVESTRIGHRPGKGDDSSPLPKGKTSDIVARLTNKSKQTIDKIKQINEAANKNPKKFARILERVDSEKMSVNTAHKIVTQRERSLRKVPLPKGKTDLILVDLPTKFNRGQTAHGSADNHYPTMDLPEILKWFDKENAASKIADNAIGFFWFSTSIQYTPILTFVNVEGGVARNGPLPLNVKIKIPFYLAVMFKLGFDTLDSEFVWIKDKIGMGSKLRNQHEKLLIFTKGQMPLPAKLFSSVISAPRGEHSRKPEIYDMLDEMYPGRTCEEWFSRYPGKRKGWKFHGNQLGGK